MTVEELTKLSMLEMQVTDPRNTPTVAEYAMGLQRLNTLISSLQNDMVFLAYQDVQSITTVAGREEYVSEIGTYRIRGFADDKVNILSRRGYDQFKPVQVDGGRVDVYVEYNYNPPIIQFASTPEVDGTEYSYRRDVMVTNLVPGQSLPLKDNAIEMLILGLAYKLCPSFGVEVSRRADIQTDYNMELNKYRQAQTVRVGDEIVKPVAIEVV